MRKVKDKDWKVRVPGDLDRELRSKIGRRSRQFVLLSLLRGVNEGLILLPSNDVPAASAPVVEG